ncbi:hypothetical protein AKJ09_00040 [Labilithrix luteola]|uniref:Uncharacterized protein n=1 Tax=Labilithrix luteola TaxID=1391654 RepID=A0A0K1PJ05_9BACT|nr:hypothetical protein [Labilithrix luteola]AKU93376.1 hypothetical protein AKJ09_00040 [Labilithrix luteola]
MADRSFHSPETQGVRHVQYNATLKANAVAANAPTFVEGDTPGASVGSYLIATKIATGKYRFKTTNPFAGLVNCDAWIEMAAPDNNSYAQIKQRSQNADGTWQFELWVVKNAAGVFTLVDVTAGDYINVQLTLRNSTVKP